MEKEYFREWERTTAVSHHKATMLSTALCLPPLIKYYIVPTPLRYVWFFVWQALLAVARQVERRLILQGAPL